MLSGTKGTKGQWEVMTYVQDAESAVTKLRMLSTVVVNDDEKEIV